MLATVIPTRGRVVDFGCGDGRVTLPMRELGYNVIAVDSSVKMLATINEPTLWSDGSDLSDLLGMGVSTIYSLAVLIHHDYAGQREIIANLAKATRKGGLLVLDWPTSKNPYERKGWIEVTTISEADRAATAKDLGLIQQQSDLPWPVYKRG